LTDRAGGTVRDALKAIGTRLAAAGCDAPELDARWLVAHSLGVDRATLARREDEPLPAELSATLETLVRRRERGEPLAYLLGEWEFWSLTLEVTPSVLVPRPETELLVEWGIELLRDRPAPRIADLGTGSGCIAIALAVELPRARVDAVDISPAALAVAARNVARHGIAARVRLHAGDLLAPLAGEAPYDLIVSNPPYIAAGDPRLDPRVAAHEPALALYDPAGGDGLGFHRRIAGEAPRSLAEGGSLLLELPEDGAARLRAICEASGLAVEIRRDLAGIERALRASRVTGTSSGGPEAAERG